ncbi:hypothetical protein AB1Y20_014691 [Prymnesium parvum]|uniref:Uncharacterized protein n=1 Tax=Prymnesium parvum TaxID=97485 RepID=A0AB34IDL8_PRYPA
MAGGALALLALLRLAGSPAHARVYSPSRMYGARTAFRPGANASFLRRLPPRVLAFASPAAPFNLSLPPIEGPASLGLPATRRPMGLFNPSLVAAPPGLCPRCAYLVALRVDALHQCDDSSPLLRVDPRLPRVVPAHAWFKGTAVAALDARLRPLAWTWLLNAPQHQVAMDGAPSRWTVPSGAAGGFAPPWAKAVYDVRLVELDGRLFATYVCRRCTFSVASLQVTAEPTATGGLRALRVWQSRRFTSAQPWAQGRNQALFAAARRAAGPLELMVQPWLGLVGSFGAAAFRKVEVFCSSQRARGAGPRVCGATPLETVVRIDEVSTPRFGATLELLANHSDAALRRETIGGSRLSTTSNLVRVVRRGGACTAYVGVGHTHRREGKLNLQMKRARRRGGRRRGREPEDSGSSAVPFMWGYEYTHFFYAIEPHEPFRLLGTSQEFCIALAQDEGDCESVQFISSITLTDSRMKADQVVKPSPASADTLLLSYGVNDCEAKVAKMPLEQLWSMLQPVEGFEQSCVNV